MSITDADIAFAKELFAPLGDVTSRKMFGGMGLYCDDEIFCLVNRTGQIYLKAKGDFADILAGENCTQFGADHGRLMPYWTLPDAALDDPETASDWARKAIQALS